MGRSNVGCQKILNFMDFVKIALELDIRPIECGSSKDVDYVTG